VPAVAPATTAVADFEGGSIPPDKKTSFWSRALASFIIADLAKSQNLRVVDRGHLAEVLQEQRLSATDLSDQATRLRVGKILGAKYFIFGTYNIVGDQAALTARMDSVETGQILISKSVFGTRNEMRTLSQQLAVDFLRPLDGIVAKEEADSASGSGEQPAAARSYFNQGLMCEQQGKFEQAADLYTKALSASPHYEEARIHLESASEAAARQ
jgi:TolB-like protein